MDRSIVGSGIIAGFCCAAFIYVAELHSTLSATREQLRVSEKSNLIANDQINDLTYQLLQRSNDERFAGMREFVAGAVDALRRPEYYNEVWHAGYDRGSAVEQYAKAIESGDKTYTQTKE